MNGGSSTAAGTLAELVRGRGPEIETTGRLPPDVASAVRSSTLMRMLMPSALGGDGGAWRAAFDAIETVAAADGSTGWTAMIGMTINMLTGYVQRDEALELFSASSAPLFTAGVFEPRGIAQADGSGDNLRVSGHWRFGTGIHLADWFCATATVRSARDQQIRHFIVPRSALTVQPNWSVTGLCGTGSDDVQLDAVPVRRQRSFSLTETPWPDEPFWQVSFYSITALLMAAAVLGMTRRGLDSVVSRGGNASPSHSRFAENRGLEADVASAEATIRAGRAFTLSCMEDIEASVNKGAPPSEHQRALLWLAAIHTARSCGAALEVLFTGEGASGIRRDSPLQRSWRDVHAASTHVVMTRKRLEAIGRLLLGSRADAAPFL